MYRANGLLVSNCDALRYGLMSLHERKSLKPLAGAEKKLQEMKRRDMISPRTLNDFYIS